MNNKYLFIISLIAAIGGFLFGFDTAIISGTIVYIKPFFNLNAVSLGWAVGSGLIGCAIGAISAGYIADKYGRRASLIVCALLFAFSGVGASLSDELYELIIFRIIGGLGVGAAAMVSPMYIAEIAPAQHRGRLVAFYQLAIVTGILIAYYINYVLSNTGPNNWRWMFGSQAAPSIIFLILLLFVPETPRWLIKKNRYQKALDVMKLISPSSNTNQEELETIKRSFTLEDNLQLQNLFNKKYTKVLFIGILLAVFQQITGINAILYYAPVIFNETGIGNNSSLLYTIIIGAVNVASTIIAIGFVDKVGRKKFLLNGSILMGVSLITIAICFYTHFFKLYIVLMAVIVYVASFGCTLGAVTWVYLSEIFPNSIRAYALSLSTFALWLADFIISYSFPVLTDHLSTPTTLTIYALFCAVAYIYTLTNIKETKGKTLEEIETLFT